MMDEIDRLVDQNREELEQTFAQKHKRLIATTEVFKQTLESCRQQGRNIHAELWNVGIYMNIAAHDLSVLVMQLHFERDTWTRRQIARHVALMIYESTEDMTQLLGKKIRGTLSALGLLQRFDMNLRVARQPLDRFWKDHQGKLSDIRCMSAAHRDLDGLALLKSIETINILQMTKLGMEFGGILNDIGCVVQAILSESSKIPPPS
jgi:hypothetical protein